MPTSGHRVGSEFASGLAFRPGGVDTRTPPCSTRVVRKSASVRLGLLLAVSALLVSCEAEKPKERRCVDDDGRFVDEARCGEGAPAAAGEVAATPGATGGWDGAEGGQASRGGYHFIWIPYGMYGGVGTYAPGYLRPGTGHPGAAGPATTGSVSRGGFGATGATHAGAASAGT